MQTYLRNLKNLIILSCVALAALVFADTVEESTPFDLQYEHSALYSTRIFANGVPVRDFQTNEVRHVSSNGTTNSYAVTMQGFNARNVTFTATVFYMAGTNEVQSAQSDPCQIQFRPRKPGNFRRFQ